jgi:hypothetical protein
MKTILNQKNSFFFKEYKIKTNKYTFYWKKNLINFYNFLFQIYLGE